MVENMPNTKFVLHLARCTITVFDNDEYAIHFDDDATNSELTVREFVFNDLRKTIHPGMSNEEFTKVAKAIDLVVFDNNPYLWLAMGALEHHCCDCGVSDDDKIRLHISEFSPGHRIELVCNACEKNRGKEYFSGELPPWFKTW